MFSHIMIGANDIEESKVFYDAVLGVLGCKPGVLSMNPTDQKRYMYFHDNNIFIITEPIITIFLLLLSLLMAIQQRMVMG